MCGCTGRHSSKRLHVQQCRGSPTLPHGHQWSSMTQPSRRTQAHMKPHMHSLQIISGAHCTPGMVAGIAAHNYQSQGLVAQQLRQSLCAGLQAHRWRCHLFPLGFPLLSNCAAVFGRRRQRCIGTFLCIRCCRHSDRILSLFLGPSAHLSTGNSREWKAGLLARSTVKQILMRRTSAGRAPAGQVAGCARSRRWGGDSSSL